MIELVRLADPEFSGNIQQGKIFKQSDQCNERESIIQAQRLCHKASNIESQSNKYRRKDYQANVEIPGDISS
jgi:hypothetical protein